MEKVKKMPYEEKYRIVVGNIEYHETSIQPLVGRLFGDQAAAVLRKISQEGLKPIPQEASFEEKYEIAYGNWVWSGKSVYKVIRNRMGEEGIRQFERPNVEVLKQRNASPALYILGLIRVFSTGLAFSVTARKMAYQLQWLTPFSVSELTRHKAVIDIPRCKILDYPDNEDSCLVACQHTYPKWVAEQFKIKWEYKRQGNSCSLTLSPL